ncbi:MFS general substrate transporter [Conidiobolus coronatus NRRL 28638]|uniref:MFS general substrate transporter n=1 Tax=Conidiobolus coronatus (strain ATCC 28846 / CBS 209.66 / NRRL 28638) TaxID=796925 RepID=A0A137PFB0_CONC2|nr:MFS general substrate transporter [Conidiobolus coronatus NRRL 28638]|eukprot:KXN73683.1 MFS general substrate transporter [Conidiobolus coronatus NRRL 28638]
MVKLNHIEAKSCSSSGSSNCESTAYSSSNSSSQDIDFSEKSEEEIVKGLLFKMDCRIIPYISLLYLFSFLDRVNIGYARLYKMEEELHLNQFQYGWSLSIFFISYVIFEVPSNLLLKKYSPSVWIARIMVTWGALTIALGFVKNFAGLMAGRFFLGMAEAGLFPGVLYYLSFWYTRRDIGFRLALFCSSANLAGGLSGLLAYTMSKIDGTWGISGWQWIFIIEGILSVIFGFTTIWLLPNSPSTAKWLNQTEKFYVVQRLLEDHRDPTNKSFCKKQFLESFVDYKVYFHMIIHFGLITPLYCVAQLLPTIISQMGFSKLTTLLLTAPPYMVAVITNILLCRHSDKKMERGMHLCVPILVSITGFMMMIFIKSKYGRYAGSCVTVIGVFTAGPISLTWMTNNMVGSTKSATASALLVSYGNIGGFISGMMFRSSEAPRYTHSLIANIGFLVSSLIAILLYRFLLIRENSKLDTKLKDPNYDWTGPDGLNMRNFRYVT